MAGMATLMKKEMNTQTVTDRLSQVKKLSEVAWHEDVENRPGVFLLRETKDGHVKDIGMAEVDVRSVLVIHGDEFLDAHYKFYSHRHASDEVEVFELACKYFHQYQTSLKSHDHPVSPTRTSMNCPVHSCNFKLVI